MSKLSCANYPILVCLDSTLKSVLVPLIASRELVIRQTVTQSGCVKLQKHPNACIVFQYLLIIHNIFIMIFNKKQHQKNGMFVHG